MSATTRKLNTPRWPLVHGWAPCRWCGKAVLSPDGRRHARRRWHPECVLAYRIANFPQDQQRVLRRRDHGVCASCGLNTFGPVAVRRGTFRGDMRALPVAHLVGAEGPFELVDFLPGPGFEADHRIPLWSVDPALPWDELKWFWSEANLQTLCRKCHKAKSAREAAERAAIKRAAAAR